MKGWNINKCIMYLLTPCLILNTWLPSVLAVVPPAPNTLPGGGSVPVGYGIVGAFDYSITGELHVRDVAEHTVINWDNFDIGSDAMTQFHQLGVNPAVLNRINDGNPTGIFGSLQANGRVFIVNPAGVVFGDNSTVNVTQLVASGLAMSNTDFINAVGDSAQPMIFSSGAGDVTNNGTITTTDSVYLVGESVMNKGAILCPGGLVVLAAGDTLHLGQPGSSVIVDIGTDLIADVDNSASNSGTIGEVGSPVGQIVLAAGDVFSQAAITNAENLAVVANENVMFDGDVDVTGSVDVLAGQNPDTGAFLGVNSNITAADIKLKNGAETGPETIGETTDSAIFIEPTKNLTATDGGVVIQAVHDIFLGGNVEATGDIYINANEDGYDDPQSWWGFYYEYPYGGGDVIADGTITAGGKISILGNAMRFEGDVTTAIDLLIVGRTSADPAGETLVNGSQWGEIRVAAGTVLSAGYDVSIWDGGGGPEDPPAPDMMPMIGDESLTIAAGTGGDAAYHAFIMMENTALWVEGPEPGGSLTLEQDRDLDLRDDQWNLFGQPETDLTLISHDGAVTAVETGSYPCNAADQWASIEAVAQTDITLSGNTGNITTRQLTSAVGDIEVTANNGQILATESIEATSKSVTLMASEGINIDDDITAGTNITLAGFHNDIESAGDILAGRNVNIFSGLTLDGGHWALNDDVWSWEDGDQFITASDGKITLELGENWICKKTPGSLYMSGGSHDLAIDIFKFPNVLPEHYAVATAGNLYIRGSGDVFISDDVTALGGEYWGSPDLPEIQEGQSVIDPVMVGGVSIVSENGKIYSMEGISNDTIDVSIEGYSDQSEGIGVDLPYGDGNAAIVLMSNNDLKVGEDAVLLAKGIYDAASVDDRAGVNFLVDGATSDPPGRNPGDPIDVAIYLASTTANAQVDSAVSIESEGTGAMVVDAYDTVSFGSMFEDSLEGIGWLEICSRRTGTLNEAAYFGTLPYADGSGPEAGYVLRGENPDVGTGAWVLEAILPIAMPDFVSTPIDLPVVGFDILSNDNVGEYTPVTVTLDSPTSKLGGTVTLNPDDTVTYEPPSDQSGLTFDENGEAKDTFTYGITDVSGMTSESTTVTITLINTLPVHRYIPGIPAAPGLQREVIETSGCPALLKWVASELGTDVSEIQIRMADSLALAREIQPCDACSNLKQAARILQDVDGTRTAALAEVISEFASSDIPPTEEQMVSIANTIANDIEGNVQYAAAGEYIDALARYVSILSGDMGFSVDEAVQFATDNYVDRLVETENISVAAYVAARLTALRGSR